MAQNIKKTASPYKATKLWNQLLSSFKEGMILKKKRWRLKTYEQCFSGAEALNWMHAYLQNSPAFDANVTRQQAFSLLQKFLENNIFESVLGKNYRQFQDTNFLYQFVNNDAADLEKIDKENIVMQNSIPNVLKYFGRKNSHSTSCENLNFDNKTSELSKQKKKFQQEATLTTRKPLTEINIMKTYSNMSTFLFDESDEESCDIFNSSISQSNFMRSNSLRFSKKSKKMPFSLKKDNEIDEERFVEPKEIVVKKSCTSKQLKTKGLLISSSSLSLSSQMNKDSQDSLRTVCSPPKRVKIDDEKDLSLRTRRGKSLYKNILNKVASSESPSSKAVLDNKIDPMSIPEYQLSEKSLDKKTNLELFKPPRVGVKRHFKEDKKADILTPKMCGRTTKNLENEPSNSMFQTSTNMFPVQASIESSKKQTQKSRRTLRKSLSQNDLSIASAKIPVNTNKNENQINQSELSKRKRCATVVNDCSRSVLNNSKASTKNVLHKAQSIWSLNEIGTSKESSVQNEIDRKEPLVVDIEKTWKSVVLLSLKKLLHVEKLSGFLDEDSISGNVIIRNVETANDSKDTPAWLQSAISCLINWPESYEILKSNQTDFINHEKLERDIFRTIREHYESISEPLFPFHFFGLLQECEAMLHKDSKAVIKVLQHTLLLLPNWNRCQLYLIVNFMKKVSCNDSLHLSADIPNKDLILHSFYHLIVRKEKQSMNKMYEDVVAMRITTFLMEHYEEIFMLPTGLRVQVDHKLAVTFGAKVLDVGEKKCNSVLTSNSKFIENKKHSKNTVTRSIPRTPSFCARISMQQYEKDAAELSRKALHDLLLSIINNKTISERDKTKQLKKFEKTYPEIYTDYNRRKTLLSKQNQ